MKQVLLLIGILICTLSTLGQGAYITSVLINSCNGSCSEGDNEIIFGNTGSGTLLATPTNLTISYGTSASPTTTYTDAFTNNATTTANLNAAAGCTLFIDAASTTIPANASFIVVRSSICMDALVWSGLCGNAPIYIIYSTDGSWSSGGNFGNGTGTTRYFKSVITTSIGTTTLNYDYTLPSMYNNDGAFANWSAAGGSPVLYGDNDCAITPTALPLTISNFHVNKSTNTLDFHWLVEDDQEILSYSLEYSLNGYNFTPFASKLAIQTPLKTLYSLESSQKFNQDWYVRLVAIDKNNRTEIFTELLQIDATTLMDFRYLNGTLYNEGIEELQISDITGTQVFVLAGNSNLTLNTGLWIIKRKSETIKLFAN